MFFLLRLIINAVALLITAWIIPGIHLGGMGRKAVSGFLRLPNRIL
jgi:uncharacterized membrane protein YvlD (DUF360 family)